MYYAQIQNYILNEPAFRSGLLTRNPHGLSLSDMLKPMIDAIRKHSHLYRMPITDEDELWSVYNHFAHNHGRVDIQMARCRSCRGLRVDMRTGGKTLCRTCNGTNKETVKVTLHPTEPRELAIGG